MKKQPKKKFVFKFSNYYCFLFRRNKRNYDNCEQVLTIDYSTLDDNCVDITFENLNDCLFESPTVKYEHHLKYIRKMSRAAFAFYKVTNELKKWEM